MSHKHRHKHSHKHKKCSRFCDRPPYFHDIIGGGSLDSTPIIVPPDFGSEVGTEGHPGPFAAQAFDPAGQRFFGLAPRRNTPNKPPEKAGEVLMDYKLHGCAPFYKPRLKGVL